MKSIASLAVVLCCIHSASAADSEGAAAQPVLHVPEGFTIELVAGPPLVKRPIVASFDPQGRLYVAESSGSNDPVEKQLAERPHRIVRLEDANNDGVFDKRTEFADRMMFPEGAMFLGGSLYVSAPPSIWKLTDGDGDGVAEQRVEWFNGGTLTGCANDLHGPYAGPDGWIYWCKGAFAEQTHRVSGREWTSSAAHIFRCRPDGSGLEPVMTGGMDNPVDVVFTPEGERIFSATFLQINGRRDGLAHAIYGGVYGKKNHVLNGHPRTGELMPALVLMTPAAPSGLERYESDVFGREYRDNLFACQFNLRKVSRHVLQPQGSTFASADSDFVTSDAVDFHPTDVLADADGSLLVIDTGGWYKLCCPTSQLWKPDVLGGIYRVRRVGVAVVDDPRGLAIDWPQQNIAQLWARLADNRPAVRGRAAEEFAARRDLPEMAAFLRGLEPTLRDALDDIEPSPAANACDPPTAALARTWALARLELEGSQRLTRRLLAHPDQRVRHAAIHAVSLHRDSAAVPQLTAVLRDNAAPLRRVAAEALGRIGDRSAVPHLLAAAAGAEDRILEHSTTYALIELADPQATALGVSSDQPRVIAAALIALDQMPGGKIKAEQVIPLLSSDNRQLRQAARWLVARHPGWGADLVAWFRQQLSYAATPSPPDGDAAAIDPREELLVAFSGNANIQALLAETLASDGELAPAKPLALRVLGQARIAQPHSVLVASLASLIAESDPALLPAAIAAARMLPAPPSAELTAALSKVISDREQSVELRVAALAIIAGGLPSLDPSQWSLLRDALSSEHSLAERSAAAQAIVTAPLSLAQLRELADLLEAVHPLELNRVLPAFEESTDEQLGLRLLASLRESTALSSLRVDVLRRALAGYSPAVRQGVDELEALLNVDAAAQRERLEELLPKMAGGDVRRGHAVFFSSKAACASCHQLGAAGGTIGPELTKIGEIRTERDLLESILFPSLSFVQSYESTLILTIEGKAISGRIIEETESEYVLATSAEEIVRVPRDDVEEIQPSAVSVMPAGFDKQLTEQELADLVAFLESAK